MIHLRQDMVDSATSYAAGGGIVVASKLMEVGHAAQAIGLVLGCLIVAVKLAHDIVKFYRYLKKK